MIRKLILSGYLDDLPGYIFIGMYIHTNMHGGWDRHGIDGMKENTHAQTACMNKRLVGL